MPRLVERDVVPDFFLFTIAVYIVYCKRTGGSDGGSDGQNKDAEVGLTGGEKTSRQVLPTVER